MPELVQGFKDVLMYGDDKIVLGGTGEQVVGSFNRAAYVLVIDLEGNKFGERFLTDAQQDHYFESMFIENDEVVLTGSFYDYDFVSIAALQLPTLAINAYQKFETSTVPFVRKIVPMSDNRVGVLTEIEANFDFEMLAGGARGFVEFARCKVMPNFTWQNTGNNTIQFSNNSGIDAIDFTWDFGGIGSSFSENPTYTFPAAGNYTICMTAKNQILCTEKICQEVVVGANANEAVFFKNVDINISQNQITINGLEKNATLEIYNIGGGLVKAEMATAMTHHSTIFTLVPGVYALVLKNEKGIRTERFVKY